MAKALAGRAWVARMREDWIAAAGTWERWEPELLSSLAAVDSHLVRALALRPRQSVLDFGCGSGEPTLTIAPLVDPGMVTGLDLSPPMIALARERARLRGLDNVRFRVGDVARAAWRGRFHAVVSRYGLMFVDDVGRTLEHVRAALKPGGRLAVSVWGPIERNPFLEVRDQVLRPYLAAPPPPVESFPNPLRLGRRGLVARHLRAAGFRSVRTRGVQAPLVYHNAEDFVERTIGAPGASRDLYQSLARREQKRVRDGLARGIRPFRRGTLLRIPGFAWIVSGRR